MAAPILRANDAGMGCSKKIQICAPFPERDLSKQAGMAQFVQTCKNAETSSVQVVLSKSMARNQQVSSLSRGYIPAVIFPLK
jgi:hypothetical protein